MAEVAKLLEDLLKETRQINEGPWMPRPAAAKRAKCSEDLIRGYIDRYWEDGWHYKVIGRTTWVHYDRFQEWISSHEDSLEPPLASESESTGAARKSMTRRSTGIRVPQL